jgi:protein-L-isoaspartate(D-aspartate) O-methyltransferase
MFGLILSIITEGLMSLQIDKFSALREKMVKEQIISRGISDRATLSAMRKVPRHLFVPQELAEEAYDDNPLPIGHGQTISQPYIVAYMTEVIKASSGKKVLEIGTGSGYQAAILAEIVDTVYTIEIIPELAKEASDLFKKMGYENILTRCGDGYNGWPEHAPFDIIIVTAAAEAIPAPLSEQLAENGRLVIPVGAPYAAQELILAVKKNGRIDSKRLIPVRFVPFKRKQTSKSNNN